MENVNGGIDAPYGFHRHIFDQMATVFYGTDDGFQDGSFGEFDEIVDFYDGVAAERKKNVHFASAVGGLYGLNLLPLWKPKAITFFDINPHAIAYFRVIRRVWTQSSGRQDFLDRLTHRDFDVENEEEAVIRENVALHQRGELPPARGAAKRSFEASWTYALDRFDLTRGLLTDVPLDLRLEGMESESFARFVRDKSNLWLYCSNIIEFVYHKLRFDCPANNVILSIIYPGQTDLLDLAPFGCRAVEVACRIPLAAEPVADPRGGAP